MNDKNMRKFSYFRRHAGKIVYFKKNAARKLFKVNPRENDAFQQLRVKKYEFF